MWQPMWRWAPSCRLQLAEESRAAATLRVEVEGAIRYRRLVAPLPQEFGWVVCPLQIKVREWTAGRIALCVLRLREAAC